MHFNYVGLSVCLFASTTTDIPKQCHSYQGPSGLGFIWYLKVGPSKRHIVWAQTNPQARTTSSLHALGPRSHKRILHSVDIAFPDEKGGSRRPSSFEGRVFKQTQDVCMAFILQTYFNNVECFGPREVANLSTCAVCAIKMLTSCTDRPTSDHNNICRGIVYLHSRNKLAF